MGWSYPGHYFQLRSWAGPHEPERAALELIPVPQEPRDGNAVMDFTGQTQLCHQTLPSALPVPVRA